jgi:hemerythrin
MRVFKWNAAHAVFLPEIDAEHRAISQTAGELHHAIGGKAPEDMILELLHGLMAAVEDHFAHEERLMQASHYTSCGWHKQQHDAVRKRAGECSQRIANGDSRAASLFLAFLSSWLRDHMAVADRMMGAHLRNHQRGKHGLAA